MPKIFWKNPEKYKYIRIFHLDEIFCHLVLFFLKISLFKIKNCFTTVREKPYIKSSHENNNQNSILPRYTGRSILTYNIAQETVIFVLKGIELRLGKWSYKTTKNLVLFMENKHSKQILTQKSNNLLYQ